MKAQNGLLQTPMGVVTLHWVGGSLTRVDLEAKEGADSSAQPPRKIRDQLDAYFADGAAGFELPLDLHGTDFQRRVWRALRTIPSGTTVTYGDLAAQLGTSARAVGGACRANPCPIVVPCHRVVAKQGLGGFAGDTSGRKLAIKRWLLRHEGIRVCRES